MAPTYAENLLEGFDVAMEDGEPASFLFGLTTSPEIPVDARASLYNASLLSGCEDWNMRLRCAEAIQARQVPILGPLDAHDVLAFVPGVTSVKHIHQETPNSIWAETDRLIERLGISLQGSHAAYIGHPSISGQASDPGQLRAAKKDQESTKVRRCPPLVKRHGAKSPFWSSTADDSRPSHITTTEEHATVTQKQRASKLLQLVSPAISQHVVGPKYPSASSNSSGSELVLPLLPSNAKAQGAESGGQNLPARLDRSLRKSPYFASVPSPKTLPIERTSRRRPAGTISALPFPPLKASSFNLIQEKLCHEPFWLLIAVTFLIKTAGKLAIPAFYRLRERFPTPAELAEPEAAPVITETIRHLGLSVVRTAAIQRYARGWLETPPSPGVIYRVRGNDQRDGLTPLLDESGGSPEGLSSQKGRLRLEPGDAWEIGHLTQGKYALDSWRIFCRDELLGRAGDWNGRGSRAGGEFQPEWMRVQPADKELRACLRWMWMKEGWEWDPHTGEKTVLRPEMERAVNEGRVEYDDSGGLRILEGALLSDV